MVFISCGNSSLIRIYLTLCTAICFLIVYYLTVHKNNGQRNVEVEEEDSSIKSNIKENERNYFLKLKSNCECRNEGIFIESLNTSTYRVWNGNKKHYDVDMEKVKLESITCDLYNVLRRGPQQKIIGISLYGTDDRYYKSLKLIARQAAKHYPEWIMRIYYDNSIIKSAICEIECLRENEDEKSKLLDNVDFCNINNIPNDLPSKTWSCDYTHSMKWRWLPIGDPFVDVFISRDSDSWFHDREYEAVKVWLKSEYLFHIMRGTVIRLLN